MATTINLGRNPTLLESLGQGLQLGLPGIVQGAQSNLEQKDLLGLNRYKQYQNQLQQANMLQQALAGEGQYSNPEYPGNPPSPTTEAPQQAEPVQPQQ